MSKKILLFILLVVSSLSFYYGSSNQNSWQNKFQKKIKKQEIPVWMFEQIAEDIKAFSSSGITKEMLDQTIQDTDANNHYAFARFQILDGKVKTLFSGGNIEKNRRCRDFLKAVQAICKLTEVPDADFIVTFQDASPYDNPQKLKSPLFAFAKNELLEKNVVLIPDSSAFKGNLSWVRKVEKGTKSYPWAQKEEKAFWRGGTTGGWATLSTFKEMPRVKLVHLSLEQPQVVDAKFNRLVQTNEETTKMLEQEGYVGDTVSVVDHLKYKYQILIDGNTCAYSRAFWQLYSNCAIFKQTSPNIQWYYKALAPYVHFIPIKNDMSDLPEKIQWAREHDAEVQKIVQNANLFARHNLQIEDVHIYLYLLIKEYAKLMK